MGVASEAFGAVPSIITMSLVNVVLVALVLVMVPSIRRGRKQPDITPQEAPLAG